MFKNRKLEIRLVKDGEKRENEMTVAEYVASLDPKETARLAEEAMTRLGKKLLIGTIATIASIAVITVLANAADTALQNSINAE